MSNVRIRKASCKDLKRVYQIEQESFKDYYSLGFLYFLYDANREMFLVAEKDETVIGYLIASLEKDVGHIIAIAILPSERRKAIGKTLMEEIFRLFKALNITRVKLEVRNSNFEARKFYVHLGFKVSHTIKNYYGDEDALVYFKSLNTLFPS